MSHFASKYGVYMISRANYENGVGYSSVMDDYPIEFGPASFYDTRSGLTRWDGRDPVSGLPLLVTGYDRYLPEITQHGVTVAHDGVSRPLGEIPDICSLQIEVSNSAILSTIDGDINHLVYGVWNCQDGAEPDDLIPALEDYYILSPIPEARWTAFRNALVARGVSATLIDTWRSNNPEATPQQVKDRFEGWLV